MKLMLFLIVLITLSSCKLNPNKKTDPDYCEFVKPPFIVLRDLMENPINIEWYLENYPPTNKKLVVDPDQNSLFAVSDSIGQLYTYSVFENMKEKLEEPVEDKELNTNFLITVLRHNDSTKNEGIKAIQCTYANTTLGDLNVFGMTKEELETKFGKAKFNLENQLLFVLKNNVISIHFTNQKADWYKFARLNPTLNLEEEIPPYLLVPIVR